jgi:hypothetical protein
MTSQTAGRRRSGRIETQDGIQPLLNLVILSVPDGGGESDFVQLANLGSALVLFAGFRILRQVSLRSSLTEGGRCRLPKLLNELEGERATCSFVTIYCRG